MAIYYELKEFDEASEENTTSSLELISQEEAQDCTVPRVEVFTPEEFEELKAAETGVSDNMRALMVSDVNFVDIYPNYIVGSFSVPDNTELVSDPDMFAFFMDRLNLIFVDKGDTAANVLARIAESGIMRDATTAHCLYVFFRELLINDLVYLGSLEDSMEDFEEEMLNETTDISPSTIMRFRRKAIQLGFYYQQIATMSSILEDDENEMMSQKDSDAFTHITNLAERLTMRTDTIKEYGVQLYELQQSQIDMRQNSIMQVFTIITVLFAPLTLITGWFGMNLQVLPGLDVPFLWLGLILFGLILTAALLHVFHRRKWL